MQIATNKAGQDVMEASMIAAENVRQQIKVWAWGERTPDLPSFFGAMEHICNAADLGRSLMQQHGLDPDDIHLNLLFRAADSVIGSSPLPRSGGMKQFCEKFEQMGNVDFLGILWWQTTPDTRGKRKGAASIWITPFSKDKQAADKMLLFRKRLTALPMPQ